MGFLATSLLVGVVGAGAIMLIKDSIKETERKSTPCNFDNGISETQFKEIVEKAVVSVSVKIDNW